MKQEQTNSSHSQSARRGKPLDWYDIPVGMFQEIWQINKGKEDEDTKTLRLAALVNGITYNEILSKSLDETSLLVSNIAFMYQEPKLQKVRKSYVLNGKTYDATLKPSQITTAQYIDFQNILPNKDENLAQFFSIFFIPAGKQYNEGYDTEDVINDIETSLSIEDAVSVADFFVREYRKSMRRTLLYSEAELRTLRILRQGDKEILSKMEKDLRRIRQGLNSLCGSRWLKA